MNRSTRIAFVALCLSALIGPPALAERPSINMLNAAVNQLEAEVNQLQAEIAALQPGALWVFDASGAEIGLLADWSANSEARTYRVYLEIVDATIMLDLGGTLSIESPGGQVLFEDLDCAGQAFVPRSFVGRVTSEGGRWFIGRYVPSIDPEYQSRLPGIVCHNDQISGPLTDAVPADEITLEDLGLSFPLAAPLYVGTPPPAP